MSTSAPTGIDDVINRLNSQSKTCPSQKFALVGYSQGAAVMHGALGPTGPPYPGGPTPRPVLDQAVIPKIVALVMFGDVGFRGSGTIGPSGRFIAAFPEQLQARLKQNCAAGDPVCDPNGGGFENHLKYIMNPYQKESIAFIVAAFQGKQLPNAIKSSNDPRWKGSAPKATAAKQTLAPVATPKTSS
jgi:cutinase